MSLHVGSSFSFITVFSFKIMWDSAFILNPEISVIRLSILFTKEALKYSVPNDWYLTVSDVPVNELLIISNISCLILGWLSYNMYFKTSIV